jgi:hypothetical protein
MAKVENLSKSDKILILELAKSNMAASIIGQKFGYTGSEIFDICKADGVAVRYRNRADKRDKMIRMIKQNHSTSFIVAQVGVSKNTVAAVKKEIGITRSESVKARDDKVRQAFMLYSDGMSAREACDVIGINLPTYNRLKYKLGLMAKKN